MGVWARRILLFVAMNFAIIVIVNIVIFSIQYYFDVNLRDSGYVGLFIFSALFGFAGSFISLLMSKWMAKRTYNIQVFDTRPTNHASQIVYDTVQEIAKKNNITMPEVGIYNHNEVNAFATGSSKNNSLVAVSSGLLSTMNDTEIKGVVAHEMAHILNGDMVTMTLLQGVINTFVIFLARVIAKLIDGALSSRNSEGGGLGMFGYYIVVSILDTILSVLGMIVLMGFSRYREYKADAGSADFVGKDAMLAALEKLKTITALGNDTPQDEFASFKILGGKKRLRLFSTHPSLDERIQKLMMYRMHSQQ